MASALHGQQPHFPFTIHHEHARKVNAMSELYSCYEDHDNENIQHDETNLRTPSLDDTDDRSLDDPFKRSKRNSRTMSAANQADQTRVAIRSPRHPDKLDATSCSSDIGADLNTSRRKRQKIDPAQDDSGTQSSTTAGLSEHNISKLTTIPNESLEKYDIQHKANAENILGELPVVNRDVIAPSTPRKHVQPAANMSYEEVRPPSTTDRSKSAASPKAKRSTPRKKTMALHTNGKLLSSPTALVPLTKVAKTKNATKDKATVATRNFKMKNGRFVQSLELVLRYGRDDENRKSIGANINAILSRSDDCVSPQNKIMDESSRTHPFFLNKMKSTPQTGLSLHMAGETSGTDTDATAKRNEPVAWKDIKFSARNPPTTSKAVESPRPIWPPLSLQHVGRNPLEHYSVNAELGTPRRAKLKSKTVQPIIEEDTLKNFTKKLKDDLAAAQEIKVPRRLYLSGKQVEQVISRRSCVKYYHDKMSGTKNALISGSSAFDQGRCAGPNMWSIQYAPGSSSEVPQSSITELHKWLQGLVVHNVKSGLDAHNSSKTSRALLKKKRRKLREEFDDFIVNSDDENKETTNKNAILIVGPNGCGKTASVYAVAKELGFEVFEIHSGMRRSAKDIFDKVGDMAHNHLIQKGPQRSRSSSIMMSDVEVNSKDDIRSAQPSVAGFLGVKADTKVKRPETSSSRQTKRDQKQSLILFEEVDYLFEDDKGFWSGVQSLIQNSKRPVVMTCNDLSSIPVEELDLHNILTYTAVDDEFATDLLMHLAAAEGHIIDKEALRALYRSKRNDLRASITELSLWCQMTVGSKQGGLDWMVRDATNKLHIDEQGNPLRTFSEGTYYKGLDLVPQTGLDNETAIRFAQDSLGTTATEWCDIAQPWVMSNLDRSESRLDALNLISSIAEAQSVIDILDDFSMPKLASATMSCCGATELVSWRDAGSAMFIQQLRSDSLCPQDLTNALVPLLVEKPTFPPSQGRLAPSIDLAASKIALDIAPYVRCIVSFDMRLEQQRNEVFGSQGKVRKTRAARAAAEGGDKASTRTERWFPKDLDFQRVLDTAGLWPAWFGEDYGRLEELSTASPSVSSPAE